MNPRESDRLAGFDEHAQGLTAPERSIAVGVFRPALFLLLFATLQSVYGMYENGWAVRFVIEHVTVKSAAHLIGLIDPGVGVQAVGSRLTAPGGGINIIKGCEGADIAFLMAAAVLVAPVNWRSKMFGIVAGVGVVALLNQFRVIGLFYAYRHDPDVFDMVHGVVAPLMLVLLAAGFFIIWLRQQTFAPASA